MLCAKRDESKKNLVLVFGNPSPHSVKEAIMFSYEGKLYKTHRVWKVLQDTGIINIPQELCSQSLDDYKEKGIKRNDLVRDGLISDKFNLSLFSYFTLPSASSDLKWSGVAGLKKLLGRKAWEKFKIIEHDRFLAHLTFLPLNTKILVFQKDVYDNIIENSNTLDITLLSPTRLWYSQKVKNAFAQTINEA